MGRIYDATWGRVFAALYDRGLKATEEAGLRRDAARAAGRGERADGRARRRHRRQPRALPGRRSTELVLAEPDPHMVKQAAGEAGGVRARGEIVEAPAERLPFEDAASTPPSSPSSSARFPTRPRRSPRRRGC